MVKYLISKGANVHTNNDMALLLAAQHERIDTMVYLISQGANMYDDFNYNYILYTVTRLGYVGAIKSLAKLGVNLHEYDDHVFRLAAEYGHLRVVRFLVNRGANIHASDDQAFQMSVHSNNLKLTAYLINKGANIHANNDWALRYATKYKMHKILKVLQRPQNDSIN